MGLKHSPSLFQAWALKGLGREHSFGPITLLHSVVLFNLVAELVSNITVLEINMNQNLFLEIENITKIYIVI